MKAREIPFDETWDVIVAGGGPAGCTAAAAAAREGKRTLLIEATGCLGGMGTAGLVPAWCPFTNQEEIIYRGLAQRVFEASKADVPHLSKADVDWVPIDPERLKRVYDDLVTEAGAKILFNTVLSAVETDGNKEVAAVIVSNKAGLSAYRAKVYIDCTGDADLAAWAGAECEMGDEEGGLQAATHCFVLSNVDGYAYQYGKQLHAKYADSPAHDILRSRKYPSIQDTHMCNSLIGPETVGFNAGHLYAVDNTDPASLSKAYIDGRKLAWDIRNALAEFHPSAFANAYLVSTASLMGIRETRRIIGDYILTLDDYLARACFADEICRNSYYLDVHGGKKKSQALPDKKESGSRYGPGESHGIPYRCLIPKGLKNVLVAGRTISCERLVQGSVRVMPVCLAMGEAAGMAAAHAASQGGDVRSIDVGALRGRLREEGAYLP